MNKWLIILALILSSCLPIAAQGPTTDSFQFSAARVNGVSIPWTKDNELNLRANSENITILFGIRTNAAQPPLRVRYKLEGYDSNWRDGPGEMFLTIRFFNASGDQIGLNSFSVKGESPGWNGALATCPIAHRRETLTVPPRASRLQAIISSAGPPATVGVYVVANLVISKISSNSTALLLRPDLKESEASNSPPAGWSRDGTHSSMAQIVTLGTNSTQGAFAILDDDSGSHAEWHNNVALAPTVEPGDRILLEWNEAFSMGIGGPVQMGAYYASLPVGVYRFQIGGFDMFGNPTGGSSSFKVIVSPPFWRTSWFWSICGITVLAGIVGVWRYASWRRTERELSRLRSEKALEQERLRISRDIHDDLGARITEISLVSGLAKAKSGLPESAKKDFDDISKLSRELVSALYETVWAMNPENDNLDALGSYLCQMTNHLCAHAHISCRLHIADLPANIQVSSQLRHNITMVVKEAVHNAVKHARASELSLTMAFEHGALEISIEDNGGGFPAAAGPSGNGLTNMERRMAEINGKCLLESRVGSGTTVQLRVVFPGKPMNEGPNGHQMRQTQYEKNSNGG